jgi:hypothetical protein
MASTAVKMPQVAKPIPRVIRAELLDKLFTMGPKLNVEHFSSSILPILKTARHAFSGYRNFPNANYYKKVYVTSDIHSDLRKFIEILTDSGLITLNDPTFDLYSDDIYKPDVICNFTWNLENVCIVILGDIIDGSRGDASLEVDDELGCFELWIHILLYNMKIKANQKNSDVFFTFGNHDYHSLLVINEGMIENYVTRSSKFFFGKTLGTTGNMWMLRRASVLLPFYEVDPFIYFSLKMPDRANAFTGIHAGFHLESGVSDYANISTLQTQIRNVHHTRSIRELGPQNLSKILGRGSDGGLWSRIYSTPKGCTALQKDMNVEILVVGHCPTMMTAASPIQIQTIKQNTNNLYDGCDIDTNESRGEKGCVVLSCNNKLAHVDVGMSGAFYDDKDYHKHRGAEMLVLEHDPSLNSSRRYFNRIQRINKTQIITVLEEAPILRIGAVERGAVAQASLLETPPASPVSNNMSPVSNALIQRPMAAAAPSIKRPAAPVAHPINAPFIAHPNIKRTAAIRGLPNNAASVARPMNALAPNITTIKRSPAKLLGRPNNFYTSYADDGEEGEEGGPNANNLGVFGGKRKKTRRNKKNMRKATRRRRA